MAVRSHHSDLVLHHCHHRRPLPVRAFEADVSDGSIVPLGLYCRASLFEHLDSAKLFRITKAGFEFFEREFGIAYPFEKYDQLFVPEFNAGAMENAGAVTILENYVFRSRPTEALVERRTVNILHELAHMWFGDLVTMRWWNDLWLNESFAEFMSTLATAEATEFSDAWTTFATIEKSWAYRQDQLPSTHPIVAPIEDLADVEVNFDGITYAKGASRAQAAGGWVGRGVLRRTQTLLRQTCMVEHGTLRPPRRARGHPRAGSGQLVEAVARGIRRQPPRSCRRDRTDGDAEVITRLQVTQRPWEIAGQPTPSLRPHRLAIGFYSDTDRPHGAHPFLLPRHRFRIAELEEVRGLPKPDVIVVNDADLSYAKVRFDAHSMDTAAKRLSDFDDSLTQLLILATLWDEVRDGDGPYTSTPSRRSGGITHSSGLLTQMRQLETAVSAYLPPQQREAMHARLADRFFELLETVDEGTDQAFQFVQGFV